jgi:hypothetical protein
MAQNQSNSQTSAAEGIKKSLGYATDLTSLKIKLGKAKSRRKAAYTRLGELSYAKYRPRTTDVSEDIENAIAAAVTEITNLTHEITEIELRVKLLKAGA